MSRKEVIMYKRLSMELTTKCSNALLALYQIDDVVKSINNNESSKNNKVLIKYSNYYSKLEAKEMKIILLNLNEIKLSIE